MNKATVERLAKSVLSGRELREFLSDLKNTSEGGGVLHEMHHDLMLKSRSRSPQTKVGISRNLKCVIAFLFLSASAHAQTTSFSGRMVVVPDWTHRKTTGSSTLSESFSSLYTLVHTSGTNANQMSTIIVSAGTLTNAQETVLDLTSTQNGFGDSVTFNRIKVFAASAGSSNVGNIEIGAATNNAFAAWANTNTAAMVLAPSGFILLAAPDASGYAVSTNGNIRIINKGTNTVTYTLYIGGTQ